MIICRSCKKEIPKGKLDNWKYARRIFCNHKCFSIWKKTIRHTLEYKEKMSNKLKGRKILWQDKIDATRLKNKKPKKERSHKKYLRWFINETVKYRQWRSDVYTRDNFSCVKCEQVGGKLVVHHIKPAVTIMKQYDIKTVEDALDCEELWNMNNGITLCTDCHKEEHKKHDW